MSGVEELMRKLSSQRTATAVLMSILLVFGTVMNPTEILAESVKTFTLSVRYSQTEARKMRNTATRSKTSVLKHVAICGMRYIP